MMSVICQSLDFGRHVLDYVACGCSSNTPLDRYTVRSHVKPCSKGRKRRHQTPTLACSRRNVGQCRVFSTTKPETVLDGITGGPQAFLELRKESRPISLTNLFEVVGDDLQKLNQNLLSIRNLLVYIRQKREQPEDWCRGNPTRELNKRFPIVQNSTI